MSAHGGGSGWRFSWRPDRMQRLHELGQEFELTEDRAVTSDPVPASDPEQPTGGPAETDDPNTE